MGIEVSITINITTVLSGSDDPAPPIGGASLNFSIPSNSMYVPVLGF